MCKTENSISIVRKWYEALSFDSKYNAEFDRLLHSYPLLPTEDIGQYEFDSSPDKAGFNLLMCLYFCEALEQKYRQKGIPESVLLDSLSDIVVWTNVHWGLTGSLGISQTSWIKNTLSFKLFKLGRLQFMTAPCCADIPEAGVEKGDTVMEIHIPRGGPLLKDECIRSIEAAKKFFPEYFPEQKFKCLTCFSWLLDDTLLQFLGEDSNIIKFQRLFKPTYRTESYDVLKYTINWKTTKENLGEFEPINAFTDRVKAYVLGGGKFYITLGYITAEGC